jgi:hypothetical protein
LVRARRVKQLLMVAVIDCVRYCWSSSSCCRSVKTILGRPSKEAPNRSTTGTPLSSCNLLRASGSLVACTIICRHAWTHVEGIDVTPSKRTQCATQRTFWSESMPTLNRGYLEASVCSSMSFSSSSSFSSFSSFTSFSLPPLLTTIGKSSFAFASASASAPALSAVPSAAVFAWSTTDEQAEAAKDEDNDEDDEEEEE